VSVTSATPISLPLADFGLMEGMNKLEEAAKVEIIPSATVTFDFTFERADNLQSFTTAMNIMADDSGLGAQAALEVEGDFSLEACKGRLEILSLSNRINFGSNSAALAEDSVAFLNSIAEIISRCPDLNIQVAGHTDSDGDARYNQSLSEARANAVLSYLVGAGIEADRVRSVGYGEAEPLAPNDTAENKLRNRRIEFSVVDA
jgi:outer membrane protein OmpA-like peptidoglycan-associated protein